MKRLSFRPDGLRLREAGRLVVLFVEDGAVVRYTTATLFIGYSVIAVGSGEEALGLLHGEAAIGALLTNLRPPGAIDGWDIAKRAQATP